MNVCFLKACLWKWPETHCSRAGSFWAEQLLMYDGITSRLTDRWIGWLLKLSWWTDVSLLSFFLITVNSLFLGLHSVRAHSKRLTFIQNIVFLQTNPAFHTANINTNWTWMNSLAIDRLIDQFTVWRRSIDAWADPVWCGGLLSGGNSEGSAVFGCSHNQVTFNESAGTGCTRFN